MSQYLEKMKDLALLNPVNKSVYFKNMSNYKKTNEETQKAYNDNANLFFELELKVISNSDSASTKYLKNINIIVIIMFVLFLISVVIQSIFVFLT
ncbi:hypothetical protein [Psychroserpens burtonensis]|uniref:hypothetical protein n=1 Tax=Psychroserpens burtonensis TaxID=49278 RepID=UPI0012F8AA3D|nr:hypothetical protein [Psychroserpens burtonensis]